LVIVFVFLPTAFFVGAFAVGVVVIGLTATLAAALLPRYFELSNASIGMKTTLINKIPSPYVQCFQNLFAILKQLIIISIANTGGINIHRKFRPDRPPSSNIRYRL
jgi:hypothetical protein